MVENGAGTDREQLLNRASEAMIAVARGGRPR